MKLLGTTFKKFSKSRGLKVADTNNKSRGLKVGDTKKSSERQVWVYLVIVGTRALSSLLTFQIEVARNDVCKNWPWDTSS